MGSFRRRTQSEFRRFNINYLIGNGGLKEWAEFFGAILSHALFWITGLVFVYAIIFHNIDVVLKYFKISSPVFLITSLLNRYGSYIAPADFAMIKLLKAPVMGLEKLIDLMELLSKR